MNDIRFEGQLAYMGLTDRRGTVVATTVLDASDIDKITQIGHRWSAYRSSCGMRVGYSYRGEHVALSRFLLDAPSDMQVDHKNRDTLDHRRCNLRLATHSENMQNRGMMRNNRLGARNVTITKSGNYSAQISVDGRLIYVGTFAAIEDARAAAKEARQTFMSFVHESGIT